jgi:class 3 adenylate cyclase
VLCEVVDRWGGTAQRLVGGGVVAVFGYPAAREDHAALALWAGFEVLRKVPLPVRLGIDTGEVIAPSGESASLSGLGGDVLDVAAWLREAAEPRTALVSERARLAARGDFQFGPAGPPCAACSRRTGRPAGRGRSPSRRWWAGRTRPGWC